MADNNPAAVTRRLMTARGMSLRATARAADFDPSYLSKVLAGKKPFSPFVAGKLDNALHADGAIREAATTASVTTGDPHEMHVAPELVSYFRDQLPGHYQADMYLGPRHLIPTVETQTDLIMRLARSATAGVRHDLLATGTAYTAMLGWLYQDAGELTTSAQWRDVTLALAHRAGDPQLISYALTNKAMMAVDLGDGRAVTDFASAARSGGRSLCAKVRVLALQHEAHGHAMLGDRDQADRLLDTAETLTSSVDDDYPWGNACRRTPDYVSVQRATCYGRTGNPRDAADAARLWDQIADSMPEQARRDNAVFAARQAAALAAVPDPERATGIAAGAVRIVQATGSARLRRELLALPEHATGWSRQQAADLREILAEIA